MSKCFYKVSFGGDLNDFIIEPVEFNSVKHINIHELKWIMEDYLREAYDKYACEYVSEDLKAKIKKEVLDILKDYTIDDVITTNWDVNVAPTVGGFKVEVIADNKNLKWLS